MSHCHLQISHRIMETCIGFKGEATKGCDSYKGTNNHHGALLN